MRENKRTELLQTIQALQTRINQLEHTLGQLSRPVIEHVTVERMYVQNPILERLEFALDQIDIKELSGALNVGNNFGVQVEPKRVKKQDNTSVRTGAYGAKETDTSGDVKGAQRLGPKVAKEATETGYRFTMGGMG